MRENVGELDQTVRGIVGPVLILTGVVQLLRGKWRGVMSVVAGTMLAETAVTRVCPLSAALGIDTRSANEKVSDFRGDINEQSDRIAHDYGKPIGIDEAPVM